MDDIGRAQWLESMPAGIVQNKGNTDYSMNQYMSGGCLEDQEGGMMVVIMMADETEMTGGNVERQCKGKMFSLTAR
jgi:hypothetical protein